MGSARRQSPPDEPLISAIVVSFETKSLTLAAVSSLQRFLPAGSEIWVVDNGSSDGSAEAVRAGFPAAKVIALSENVGFGRANNVAMERAAGELLLLLNSDARLRSADAVERMIELMRDNPLLGVVGPRLESEDGALEHSARAFPSVARELVRRYGLYLMLPRRRVGEWLLGDFWAPAGPRSVDWVTGACILVRRRAFEQVGGFHPRIFMYGEEQEWCFRIKRAGWRVLYDPRVAVVHRRAASGFPDRRRLTAALRADVELVRSSRGGITALIFYLVRLGGFLLEAAAFATIALIRPGAYRRGRARYAWRAFTVQAHPATWARRSARASTT